MREIIACIGCQYESDCDSPPTLGGQAKKPVCKDQLEIAKRKLDRIVQGLEMMDNEYGVVPMAGDWNGFEVCRQKAITLLKSA